MPAGYGIPFAFPEHILGPPAPPTYEFAGFTKTTTTPWYPRDGARLEFFIGKYWLLGGWNPNNNPEWGSAVTTNSVWSSPDLITWTLELPFDANPPTSGAGARWTPRHTFMSFVRDGLLWVVGGDNVNPPPVPSDVWTSPDGTTWTQVSPSSPWGPAYLAIPGNYADEMHVMGGSTNSSQHWSSYDGVAWTQHPDLPFNRQAVTNAVVLDGLMFVIGGLDQDGVTEYNDTWMFDGVTWTQRSPTAPWSARYWVATAAYDGKLWVLTGRTDPNNEAGLWSSSDYGTTWDAAVAYPYPPSHADAITVTSQDGIALVPGNVYVPDSTASTFNVKTYLDPSTTMATLAWTLWFDGTDYTPATATIAGKSSAGSSSAKTVGTFPSNGPNPGMGTINGLPTIQLVPANANFLYYTAGGGVADIVANAHWTVMFVGKINSSPSNGNPYQNPALAGSSDADWAIGVRSTGVVEAYQFVGGLDKIATSTWSAGALVCIQARYDGTNISIRIGKGAWANTLSGASSITGAFCIGGNYQHLNYADLEICEYAATNIAISDGNLDLVADDMHAKWGVTV